MSVYDRIFQRLDREAAPKRNPGLELLGQGISRGIENRADFKRQTQLQEQKLQQELQLEAFKQSLKQGDIQSLMGADQALRGFQPTQPGQDGGFQPQTTTQQSGQTALPQKTESNSDDFFTAQIQENEKRIEQLNKAANDPQLARNITQGAMAKKEEINKAIEESKKEIRNARAKRQDIRRDQEKEVRSTFLDANKELGKAGLPRISFDELKGMNFEQQMDLLSSKIGEASEAGNKESQGKKKLANILDSFFQQDDAIHQQRGEGVSRFVNSANLMKEGLLQESPLGIAVASHGAMRAQLRTVLPKALGEVGNLTEAEQTNALKMVPSVSDSKPVADVKRAYLKSLVDGIQSKNTATIKETIKEFNKTGIEENQEISQQTGTTQSGVTFKYKEL